VLALGTAGEVAVEATLGWPPEQPQVRATATTIAAEPYLAQRP